MKTARLLERFGTLSKPRNDMIADSTAEAGKRDRAQAAAEALRSAAVLMTVTKAIWNEVIAFRRAPCALLVNKPTARAE